MRKALISMVLAATALSPVAAWAQDDDGGRAEQIRQRIEQRQQARGEQRTEARAERTEARTERQAERTETRTERRAERTEVRQQRSEPSVQQVEVSPGTRAFNRRGERNLQRAAESGMIDQSSVQGRSERRQDRQDWRQDRREDRQDSRQGRREDRQDWQQDRRGDRGDWQRRGEWRNDGNDRNGRGNWRGGRNDWRNGWDRNGWRNDRRYDWQNWRYRNRSLYRLSPYYSPYRSHRYSRFSIGLFLQPLFFSQRYWIGDPYQYRLPIAPPGTQWVRYYNDVVLVDTYTGEVIDVIYDFFW